MGKNNIYNLTIKFLIYLVAIIFLIFLGFFISSVLYDVLNVNRNGSGHDSDGGEFLLYLLLQLILIPLFVFIGVVIIHFIIKKFIRR